MRPAARCALLALAPVMLALACAAPGGHARIESIEADGPFIRHLRVRLAPSHTQGLEAVLKACVASAESAALDRAHDWLCYREAPGRYWLISFAERADAFATPATLAAFVEHVGGTEARAALDELEHEVEWEVVAQRVRGWSTGLELSPGANPSARLIDRTVRPGMEGDFDGALTARTAFFASQAYPLPVEGFVARSGAAGRAWQVVFARDWPSFHATDSFFAFSKGLDEEGRAGYAERKAALMPTMARAEYYDASYAAELSYASSR